MKNISSTKTYLLAALIFCSPLSIQSTDRDTQKKIAGVVLIAGAVAFGIFGVPYLMNKYHNNIMLQARMRLAKSNTISLVSTSEDKNNDAVKSELADKKATILNAWKFTWQPGVSISEFQDFSGRFNISNVFSFYLSVSGIGILNNCFSTNSTELNGNVIVNSSQLGDVTIDNPATFVAFNNCLLGNVRYNGTGKPLIELLDTVVDGNIIFQKPGIVVVDKTTLISGSIINGRVIRS